VAVVPKGYASREERAIGTIGVGYDDSEESRTAAIVATEVARRLDADLRVIRVFDATSVGTPALMTGSGYYGAVFRDIENRYREHLEQFVASLPDDVRAEPVFLSGGPARELIDQSEGTDVMVLGSRGYGPHRAVLVGGVSHAVVRDAACPVLVLPRGARPGLGELFASAAAVSAS
jgi:nucleotide-binding universal stress UspA family protein